MKLLGNRILVEPISPPENPAGIVVPIKYTDPRRHAQYRVLAVGTGRTTRKGVHLPITDIAPGDTVLCHGHFDHFTDTNGSKIVDVDQIELKW